LRLFTSQSTEINEGKNIISLIYVKSDGFGT